MAQSARSDSPCHLISSSVREILGEGLPERKKIIRKETRKKVKK
jgi:hypothetical protein